MMPHWHPGLDKRVAALEAEVAALKGANGMHTDALVEIRAKYRVHGHGALGVGGTPLLPEGDLAYRLPGE